MLDGKVIAGLCLKFPLCSADMSALFSYTEKIRADGFQAGAASRDAEVARLQDINSKLCQKSNRCITYTARLEEERDQLRAQINVLLEVFNKAGKHVRPTCFDLYDEIAATLASIPEQSLAEYRNKVIEECAAVLNVAITRLSSCGASIKNDVAISTLKEQSCRLRAMKEQP